MSSARRRKPSAPAPVPRKLPRHEGSVATVDAIVTAVERLLERGGLAALTTNRIAEVAGVSVGTIYQYFPNKEALLGALQDRYVAQSERNVRAALAGAEALPLAIVVQRVAFALLTTGQLQRPIHVWLRDHRSTSASQERYRRGLDQLVDTLAEFFARRPDVAPRDPRVAAFVTVHAAEGVLGAVVERHGQVEANPIGVEAIHMVAGYLSGAARSA